MKILLCIKQVPDTKEVRIDPTTGTLNRTGVASILNPFCEFALEKALTIKEIHGDVEIVTLTMGPAQAKAALQRTLELGADRAILLSDRAFAGSDSYATAHILASAITQCEPDFDIILCGKQAIDGDTAQVPAELAEFLRIPQINYADAVKEVSEQRLLLSCEAEYGYEIIEGKLPLLVTVSKGHSYRNFPSVRAVLNAAEKEIRIINATELQFDPILVGLDGSPTKVVRTEAVSIGRRCEMLDASENMSSAVEGFWRRVEGVLEL